MKVTRSSALSSVALLIPFTLISCGTPTVDAGMDHSVAEESSVLLTASGDTPGSSGTAEYRWEQLSGPALLIQDPNHSSIQLTAPSVEEETALMFEVTLTVRVGTLLVKAMDTVTVTVLPNPAPAANAGVDATVTENAKVTLQGQGDIDTEDVELDYSWAQTVGPAVNISAADSAIANFVAPVVAESTALEFTLTVTADEGNISTDEVVITVEPDPPTADAGTDQIVTELDAVNLDASASEHPDGGVLGFEWAQIMGPDVELSSNITAEPFFTAPEVSDPTLLRFQVLVTAEDGSSDRDQVDITIEPFGDPQAQISGDEEVFETQTVNLTGINSVDPAGGNLTYEWDVSSGDVPLSSTGGANTSFTASTFSGDTNQLVTVRLTVTNEEGLSTTSTFNVTVKPYPAPLANAGPDQTVDEGDTVTLDGAGSSDPVGGALTLSWSEAVQLSDETASNPSFDAPLVGQNTAYTFTLTVTNELGESSTDTVVITVVDN